MTSRIATGRNLRPSLMLWTREARAARRLPFTPEQLAVTHDGMFRVVNGPGTGGDEPARHRRGEDGRQDRHRAGRRR